MSVRSFSSSGRSSNPTNTSKGEKRTNYKCACICTHTHTCKPYLNNLEKERRERERGREGRGGEGRESKQQAFRCTYTHMYIHV